MTAMMLLTFNNMQNYRHDKLLMDDQLVETGLHMLEQVLEGTESDMIHSFHDTCAKLHRECQRKRAEAMVMVDDLDISAYLLSP
jgi:hypothetical protein